MAMENNDRPRTPTGSVASMTAVSVASERSPPPKHQESQDSTDSWDMVDDLPLRWASDYVNLASVGSKLANAPVSFFELWKNEGVGRTTSMLAVATKGCILLYETPKGERSFKFVKVCDWDWKRFECLTLISTGILYPSTRQICQFCPNDINRDSQGHAYIPRRGKNQERETAIKTGTR
jgi:hypothetical protein